MAKKPILNIDRLKYFDFGDGGKFQCKMGPIGDLIGAKKLGFNVTRVPPGKCAFPFHLHHALEEMFFILEGEGELRFGEEKYPVKQGDFIVCPTGPGTAHQIKNTGKDELKYLALSNKAHLEVCEYPDSDKIMMHAGPHPMSGETPHLRHMIRRGTSVDYFDGESEKE